MSILGSGTRDFFEFVKAIGESKSKQEEDRIITDEVCLTYLLTILITIILLNTNYKLGCIS